MSEPCGNCKVLAHENEELRRAIRVLREKTGKPLPGRECFFCEVTMNARLCDKDNNWADEDIT